jgi:hypothetical protein
VSLIEAAAPGEDLTSARRRTSVVEVVEDQNIR